MKGRKPRNEELELWSQVARTAKKLPGQRTAPDPDKWPGPKPARQADVSAAPVTPLSPFEVGAQARDRSSVSLPQSTTERLARQGVDMDAKAHKRLKRGKLAPEARLDLHGLTLDEAHPALVGFMYSAQSKGLRLVLVITGKGQREDPYDPMPRRRGVLKTQVPQWLRIPPIGPMVLQISEAHIKHGGGGAYYVYLRRRR